MLIIGEWSFAVGWSFSVLPQLVACASIQNCYLTADWLQRYHVAAQCHIKAASSSQTHRGGVICYRGRWGDTTVCLKLLWGFFFFLQRNYILVEFCEWFMLQRTQCSGKNYSVVPQFPSPTTSIWVTVICGMFPAIAENNTRASAYTLTHAHTHMHAEILIMSQSYLLHLHKRHINLTHSNTSICLQNVLSQIINFLLYNLDNVLSLSFSIAELFCF